MSCPPAPSCQPQVALAPVGLGTDTVLRAAKADCTAGELRGVYWQRRVIIFITQPEPDKGTCCGLPPHLRAMIPILCRETTMQPSPFPPGNFRLPAKLPA